MDHMNTDLSRAVDLISKSSYIALLPPRDAPTIDSCAALEALSLAIRRSGKTLGFLGPKTEGSDYEHLFPLLFSRPALPKEFIVSVATASAPISQLRYEKTDDSVDIILSPRHEPIRKEFVSFKEGNLQCDCVITFNGARTQTPDDNRENGIPEHAPVILLDGAPASPHYPSHFYESILALLQQWDESLLDRDLATLLFAGLLDATQHLSLDIDASALEHASSLLAAGADFPRASSLAANRDPFELKQLAGRAAVRSKLDKDQGVLWSFLTAEDFEKTNRAPEDVSRVMDRLSREFAPPRAVLLAWQDPLLRHVRVCVSADTDTLERIKNAYPAESQSVHLLITTPFASFQDAETQLASILSLSS